MTAVNRREQVKELIGTGNYTKAQMAEELGVAPASISSQMTYLRWMGNYIVQDENKVLRFVDEDEANATAAAKTANKKVKTASKDPQTRSNDLAKTLANQVAALAKATTKLTQINDDIVADPDDEDLVELRDEAQANVTLLAIKVKRNTAMAETLPPAIEAVSSTDEEEEEEEEELI